MAIALPPPVTPQQRDIGQFDVKNGPAQRVASFGNYRIHLQGPPLVPIEAVQKALAEASNLSDAVRVVAALHVGAGYPAARTFYALSGNDLYVLVRLDGIRRIAAPMRYRTYFDDLTAEKPLTEAAFESDRALADAASERAGENFQPNIHVGSDDSLILDFGVSVPGRRKTQLHAGFSDYGNRYSGRYLADAAVRQSFATGDELSLSGVVGLPGLDSGEVDSGTYHQGDGSLTRVTPHGVFGIQGSYIDFSQTFNGTRFDGAIYNIGGSWLALAYADRQRRFTIQGRADYTHDRNHVDALDRTVLLEHYPSVELDFAYVQQARWSTQQLEVSGTLGVRRGLGADTSSRTPASETYFLLRPGASVRYTPIPLFSGRLEATGQVSPSTVPQQEQLVIGGPASLHAYAPGVGVGDEGFNARGTLSLNTADRDGFKVEPAAFGEYSRTLFSHSIEGSGNRRFYASDYGLEVRLRYREWIATTFSAARPLASGGRDNSPNGVAKTFYYVLLSLNY